MPALMQAMKPAIAQNRPEVERDYDAMVPLLLDGMNARMNDLIEQIAALYARNFTADELREAVAFYRGPTGQKIVQKLPRKTFYERRWMAGSSPAMTGHEPATWHYSHASRPIAALIELILHPRPARTRSSIPAASPAAPTGVDVWRVTWL